MGLPNIAAAFPGAPPPLFCFDRPAGNENRKMCLTIKQLQ